MVTDESWSGKQYTTQNEFLRMLDGQSDIPSLPENKEELFNLNSILTFKHPHSEIIADCFEVEKEKKEKQDLNINPIFGNMLKITLKTCSQNFKSLYASQMQESKQIKR